MGVEGGVEGAVERRKVVKGLVMGVMEVMGVIMEVMEVMGGVIGERRGDFWPIVVGFITGFITVNDVADCNMKRHTIEMVDV